MSESSKQRSNSAQHCSTQRISPRELILRFCSTVEFKMNSLSLATFVFITEYEQFHRIFGAGNRFARNKHSATLRVAPATTYFNAL
jgi:hypothetical protein